MQLVDHQHYRAHGTLNISNQRDIRGTEWSDIISFMHQPFKNVISRISLNVKAAEASLLRNRSVSVRQSVIEGILGYAAACHPKEGILLLRGKAGNDGIVVEEVEIPPFAIHSYESSHFPLHMLPIDFSIVGTAHSHPSSVLQPSIIDLNHFYGRIMIITAYPYKSEQNLGVFDSKGDQIKYEIIRDQ